MIPVLFTLTAISHSFLLALFVSSPVDLSLTLSTLCSRFSLFVPELDAYTTDLKGYEPLYVRGLPMQVGGLLCLYGLVWA